VPDHGPARCSGQQVAFLGKGEIPDAIATRVGSSSRTGDRRGHIGKLGEGLCWKGQQFFSKAKIASRGALFSIKA